MYYGQFELDRVIHETFFKNKRNGFFVECGAFDGLSECTCKFFEDSMGWTGLNIEPVPYAYQKLIINRPNCINENCAISSSNGNGKFINAIHPEMGQHFGNGSLSHTQDHKNDLINQGCRFDVLDVSCTTFYDLYIKHNLPNIDLFVLDVEGHEVEALIGILNIPVAALPQVFCIEHCFSGNDRISEILSTQYNFHSKHAHNAFFVKKQ